MACAMSTIPRITTRMERSETSIQVHQYRRVIYPTATRIFSTRLFLPTSMVADTARRTRLCAIARLYFLAARRICRAACAIRKKIGSFRVLDSLGALSMTTKLRWAPASVFTTQRCSAASSFRSPIRCRLRRSAFKIRSRRMACVCLAADKPGRDVGDLWLFEFQHCRQDRLERPIFHAVERVR